MHYFEFGKRDATIYSGGTTSSINTGFDEILEMYLTNLSAALKSTPLFLYVNRFLFTIIRHVN